MAARKKRSRRKTNKPFRSTKRALRNGVGAVIAVGIGTAVMRAM